MTWGEMKKMYSEVPDDFTPMDGLSRFRRGKPFKAYLDDKSIVDIILRVEKGDMDPSGHGYDYEDVYYCGDTPISRDRILAYKKQ